MWRNTWVHCKASEAPGPAMISVGGMVPGMGGAAREERFLDHFRPQGVGVKRVRGIRALGL